MTTRLTIRKPDDWHLHVRDGAMLKAVLPFTARHFGRAILMPNLVPPVVTTKEAIAYRERVMAALPQGSTFKPLMTCYLTDDTDPDDVEHGFRTGVFTGVKLYPAHATTNSAAGVTDHRKIMRVLERMEKIDMPFLMHGEDVDPEVDIFDREAKFIDRYLQQWTRQFPGLRMILEHLSSKDGVDFVKSAAPQVGGTITPYHVVLTRTDWLGWGLKPYMYCMPVIKTAKDRAALRQAATSGEACYFLGTDSAPHPIAKKLSVNGIPGLFNAPVAIESYAQVFEEEGALDLLEVEAVRFMSDKPFIFTSGWASPVYTDCRRLISFPRVRATLIDFATATLLREAGFEQFDAVAGGETAGIPFAAWMADRLGLPMLYVRKKPTGFGRNSQIEGHLVEGKRVLLVEDMTSDGRSKINFCTALRQAGAKVEHALVFFFYDIFPEARKILSDLGVTLHALATWWDVLAVAKESGKFDAAKLAEIEKFMHDPAGWSKAHGGVATAAAE